MPYERINVTTGLRLLAGIVVVVVVVATVVVGATVVVVVVGAVMLIHFKVLATFPHTSFLPDELTIFPAVVHLAPSLLTANAGAEAKPEKTKTSNTYRSVFIITKTTY
ncbi:MAG: hypothetical protein EBU84_22215 [Actinobacteria bacterium]|nr:hypothetical protein [Actinomycetota bacterium]